LVKIVETCMRKVRSDRYPRASEVADALEAERDWIIGEGRGQKSLRDHLRQYFSVRQMQIDKALYALEEGFRSDDPDARDSVTLVQEAPFIDLSADLEPGPEEPAPENWTGQSAATPSMRTPFSSPPAPRTIPQTVEVQPSAIPTSWLVALSVIFGLALGLGVALIAWLLVT
jgi:hypothetical protein